MEYVLGPILALLLGMKFTDYQSKKQIKEIEEKQESLIALVDKKIVESNTQISQQSLKLMMPLAKSVTAINKQLGLWILKTLKQ